MSRPIVFWRWDNEPETTRRGEMFDSLAQRDRWVRTQRANNARHPDEAQMIMVDILPRKHASRDPTRDELKVGDAFSYFNEGRWTIIKIKKRGTPLAMVDLRRDDSRDAFGKVIHDYRTIRGGELTSGGWGWRRLEDAARRDVARRDRRRPQMQLPYGGAEAGPLFAPRHEPSQERAPAREPVQHSSGGDFAARRQARIDRMRQRAERLARESEASRQRRYQILDRIPPGQPILVGHHSERRARKDIQRMDSLMRKEIDARHEAERLERSVARAEAGAGGISSDDPEALVLLRQKLAETERQQHVLAQVNKKLRAGATPEAAGALIDWWQDPAGRIRIFRSMGHKGLPPSNIAAEVRRIKARIADLEQRRSTPARTSEAHGDARIEEADNRVRIYFPGKPSDEVRTRLKRAGFRWSPTEGAWQRMASTQAWYAAREVLGAPQRDPARRGTSPAYGGTSPRRTSRGGPRRRLSRR